MSAAPAPTPSRWLMWHNGPVIAAGLVVLAYSLWQLPATPEPIGWITIGALALIAGSFSLKLPGVSAQISVSDTFFFVLALLYGPAPAAVAIALDSFLVSWRRSHRAHMLLFNTSSNALALWCGAQVYRLLLPVSSDPSGLDAAPTEMFLPLAGMAVVYFLLNSGMTCVAVSLTKRVPGFALWREHFAGIAGNYLAAASASFTIVILMREGGLLGTVAVLPLLYVFYVAMRSNIGRLEDAQKHITRINDLYLSTVSAFATAIEAKDGVTSNHIHRVRAYAMELSRTINLTDALTLQALEAAALLHDTGKLAVPEHILNKPGKLTAHEFDIMKLHVEVGAGILSSIDFPYPVVPIVAAHHENWDGSGYPNGLRGEDIPIGARILSVVDCYDALTSDRPYRRAMSDEVALQFVKDRSGTMYDPRIVEAFLAMDRTIPPAEAPRPELQQALRRISGQHIEDVPATPQHSVAPAAGLAPVPTTFDPTRLAPTGLSDDARALEALVRVTTQAPTVTDVGQLANGALRAVVPGGTLALYTVDIAHSTLVASYASGVGEDAVLALTMRVGDRLSGWVAANARAMVNAQAELDCFELAGLSLRFATCVPLLQGDDAIGVLTFYTQDALEDDQIYRLDAMASSMSDAVRNAAAGTGRKAESAEDKPVKHSRPELRVVGAQR